MLRIVKLLQVSHACMYGSRRKNVVSFIDFQSKLKCAKGRGLAGYPYKNFYDPLPVYMFFSTHLWKQKYNACFFPEQDKNDFLVGDRAKLHAFVIGTKSMKNNVPLHARLKGVPHSKSWLQNFGRNEREIQILLHTDMAEFSQKITARILLDSYVATLNFPLISHQNSGTNFWVWTVP